MQLNEFIKTFTNVIEEKSSTRKIHRGSVESDGILSSYIPVSFKFKEVWSNGFRSVWISEERLATITYCEGDVYVSKHLTITSFLSELFEATEFYQVH